jgi:transposase
MGEKRRQFSREFKIEAVRLASESDRPLSQVARELGIRPSMLRRWREQVESRAPENAFPGNGKLSAAEEEVRRLRRENAQLRQERDFLRKTAAYFARESR